MNYQCLALILYVLGGGTATSQTVAPVSTEDLVSRALSALASKDRHALQQLSITEAEFKQFVWPTITPPTMGAQSKSAGYFRSMNQSSDIGIDQRLADYGGRQLKLVKVSFASERPIRSGRILTNPEVTAVAKSSAASLPAFWSTAELLKS